MVANNLTRSRYPLPDLWVNRAVEVMDAFLVYDQECTNRHLKLTPDERKHYIDRREQYRRLLKEVKPVLRDCLEGLRRNIEGATS